MSWFMATIYDRFMEESEQACLRAWRAELLGAVSGEVLEIGAGTGANLEHYGSGIDRLMLCEPDRHMRARLAGRASSLGLPSVDVLDASVERLPVDDASIDAVVGTLVLCSVADQVPALAEIRRVLRPGGRYVFLEHVAAEPGSSRHRWQRLVNPVWKRLADGCHVTRRTEDAIEGAGFRLESVRRASIRKALPIVRPSIRGVAVKEA